MPADGMWLPLKKEFGTSRGGSYLQASVSTLEMKREECLFLTDFVEEV